MADEETIVIKYSKSLDFTSHFADGSMISTSSKPGDLGMVQILFYETAVDAIQETATRNPDGTYRTVASELKIEQNRECRARLTMTHKTANELLIALKTRLDSNDATVERND